MRRERMRHALRSVVILLLWPTVVASADPPLAAKDGVSRLSRSERSAESHGRQWVRHRVLPAERLDEIAARYGVRPRAIIRWNDMDPHDPFLRAGDHLRIYARRAPEPRERIRYTVQRGDSWHGIANRFGVNARKLRHWNRDVPVRFHAGAKLTVWVEPQHLQPDEGRQVVQDEAVGDLPLQPVPTGAVSVGRPTRGRLLHGIQLPKNPALYTLRRPEHTYGSTHAVRHLQLGIARFRAQSEYEGELVISDMSRRRGGRLRPHNSHRSGRDVDIRLPAREELPEDTVPRRRSQVDWRAAWTLIKSLIDTGEVKYIFLSRSRQRELYRAAREAGVSEAQLGELVQYPGRSRTTIVRHARGHTKHIHVRFTCGDSEPRCRR